MLLSGYFARRRRKQAIDLYLRKLRPQLGRLFGKAEHYTPDQVQEAITAAELPEGFAEVGLAIYCTAEDFRIFQNGSGNPRTYSEARDEIGNLFFLGNSRFSQSDVTRYAQSRQQSRQFGPSISADDEAIGKYGSGI